MNPPVYLPLIFLCFERGLQKEKIFYFLLAGLFLALSFFSGNLESFYFLFLFFAGVQLLKVLQKPREKVVSVIYALVLTGLAFICFSAIDLFPTLEMVFYSKRDASANLFQTSLHFVFVLIGCFLAMKFMMPRKGPKANTERTFLSAVLLAGLFIIQINREAGYAHLNLNIFYPNVSMLFLKGREAFEILRDAGIPVAGLKTFIVRRFVFYIQPPIYLFSLPTLFLFLWGLLKSKQTDVKLLGFLAVLLALFAYTPIPNLNVRLFHLDQIAYPRLMFSFFFLLSVIMASALTDIENVTKKRILINGGIFAALAGFVIYTCLVLPGFNHDRFQALLAESRSGFATLSLRYASLTAEALRFFIRHNPLLYWFGASKYLALIMLLWSMKTYKPWKMVLFLLFFSVDIFAAWNFYTFQRPDLSIITEPSAELDYLQKMDPVERIGTRNDPNLTVFNFYDAPPKIDFRANLPLFQNRKTIEGATLNLSPSPFNEFWKLEPGNDYTPTVLNAPHSKIYDLMGMKYLFSMNPDERLPYRKLFHGKQYSVYENMQSLPRFYYPKHVISASVSEIKEAIFSADWNPADIALIQGIKIAETDYEGHGSVKIIRDSYNYIHLETASKSEGFLATTDAFHPHWQVRVDGKKQRVVRTNFYFKGIFLPAGDHQVEFYYSQPSFILGSLLSFASILFLMISFFTKTSYAKILHHD
jgi:hypothetical protein